MTSYVVDASVAAKWFLPRERESLVTQALSLLKSFAAGDCRLVVPDLFWPEMGSILWKAVRTGRISAASSDRAVRTLEATEIVTFPCRPLLQDAVTIAVAFDRSVYDAIYVALAISSNIPLLTADERLANALAGRFPIRWLGVMPA